MKGGPFWNDGFELVPKRRMANWVLGDRPAEIIDVRDSNTQLAFRVAAVWD